MKQVYGLKAETDPFCETVCARGGHALSALTPKGHALLFTNRILISEGDGQVLRLVETGRLRSRKGQTEVGGMVNGDFQGLAAVLTLFNNRCSNGA